MGPSATSSGPSARSCWRQDRSRYGPRAWLTEPTIYAVAAYRLSRHMTTGNRPRLAVVATRWLSTWVGVVLGVELPPGACFGPGLRVYHGGAVVVHASVVAGQDCTLRQGVTLGERRTGGPVPVLGDRVDVGAHAQVLGGVSIGDDARIGALALVLEDVPAAGTALAPRAVIRPSGRPTST